MLAQLIHNFLVVVVVVVVADGFIVGADPAGGSFFRLHASQPSSRVKSAEASEQHST